MFRRVALVVILLVSLPALATAGVPATPASTVADEPTDGSSSVERAAVDPPTADGPTADASTPDVPTLAAENITRSIELRLTPEDPGTYEATVTYDLPESVTSLEVSLGSSSSVTDATGFERSASDTWTWTESTNRPTLELSVDANVTSAGRRGASAAGPPAVAGVPSNATVDSDLVFVDAGSWALVRVPRVGTNWRWSGSDDVGLDKETTVAGPGATGGEMAYMGAVTRYEAEGRGEDVTLVVPDRATLNESPETILDSLSSASERLRVGARSEEVFFIAAPGDVEWGVSGLQYGADDAWVLADSSLSTPDNVWLHEYVHTRQSYRTTESGTWVVEATAEYYAALLSLEQGHVTYDAFRENLAAGQRDQYADDVLAAPSTWSGGANYLKGSLAVGATDLALRRATDRTATFQSVSRELNAYNGSVSNDVVLDAVEDASDGDVRSYAAELTRTDRTAETWSESTHEEQFKSLPAVFEYRIGERDVTATGVLGSRDLAGDSVALAVGETLTVDLAVANVGWEAGTYSTEMTVDGTVVANRSGDLDASSSTTETFTRTFDRTGTYVVSVGDRTFEVSVVERPSPVVASVTAPSTAAAGENVTFTVTYRNDGRVPANITVPFSLDGDAVADRTVLVPAESSIERSYSVSFANPGEHTIRVGETTVTVDVTGETSVNDDSSTDEEEPVPTPVPGFGVPVALAALAVLVTFVTGRLVGRR